MRKLKLIYLFFLIINRSINLRTVNIFPGYITCFSALRIKFATNVLSGTRPSKKDGAPTTDFAFLLSVKWRHVRGDTLGFWIIPRTPLARNKFPTARSRLPGKKKREVPRI